MLKPQKMSRVIITGTKSQEEKTIEILFKLDLLHIKDYQQEYTDFRLGQPLKRGTKLSEDLIKIRSLTKNLDIDIETEPPVPGKRFSSKRIPKQIQRDILPLQRKVTAISDRKHALEQRKADRLNVRELLLQLSAFPIPLELYSGYNNLVSFIGTTKSDPEVGLKKITREYELFKRPGEKGEIVLALFVHKKHSKDVLDYINSRGFTPIDIPSMRGNVKEQIAKIDTQLANLDTQIEKLNAMLDESRTKFKYAIIASEEYLSNEVSKTDAPLRFASSRNAFIVEGWIPDKKLELLRLHLSSTSTKGIHIDVIEEKGEEIDTPIHLENPKAAKPYEYLIELFSLPSYKEFDPTMVLYLIFPIFFGFMIGDVGYGIALVILAVIMGKVFPSEDAKNIARIVFIGGIFSAVFGLLIFADAFGIPFHAHNGDEVSWSGILGVEIPIYAAIHKLGTEGIIEMLVLSVFAAFIHLGLGFIIGIYNEAGHNNKHALAKLGWFIVLLAINMLIMNMAKNTLSGEWVGKYILFNTHLNAYEGIPGLPIPYATIELLVIGLVVLIITEGIMAVIEILSLVGNMISYTRLAAIGVAKGAVAVAFNTMLIPLIAGGNIGLIIVGAVLMFICHMLVIILGAISSGIQAVRLNYVEFFLKFYKGGGVKFQPFGAVKKYTI